MTSLYDLDQEFKKLVYQDELTDDDLIAIDKLHGLIEDKIVSYACVIRELKGKQAETEKAIIDATVKLKRISDKIEKLEIRIQQYMTANGIRKIDKHPLFDVTVHTNRSSVDDYSREEIPSQYWKKKEMLSLDKEKIKSEIEMGVLIPGARLINKIAVKIG